MGKRKKHRRKAGSPPKVALPTVDSSSAQARLYEEMQAHLKSSLQARLEKSRFVAGFNPLDWFILIESELCVPVAARIIPHRLSKPVTVEIEYRNSNNSTIYMKFYFYGHPEMHGDVYYNFEHFQMRKLENELLGSINPTLDFEVAGERSHSELSATGRVLHLKNISHTPGGLHHPEFIDKTLEFSYVNLRLEKGHPEQIGRFSNGLINLANSLIFRRLQQPESIEVIDMSLQFLAGLAPSFLTSSLAGIIVTEILYESGAIPGRFAKEILRIWLGKNQFQDGNLANIMSVHLTHALGSLLAALVDNIEKFITHNLSRRLATDYRFLGSVYDQASLLCKRRYRYQEAIRLLKKSQEFVREVTEQDIEFSKAHFLLRATTLHEHTGQLHAAINNMTTFNEGILTRKITTSEHLKIISWFLLKSGNIFMRSGHISEAISAYQLIPMLSEFHIDDNDYISDLFFAGLAASVGSALITGQSKSNSYIEFNYRKSAFYAAFGKDLNAPARYGILIHDFFHDQWKNILKGCLSTKKLRALMEKLRTFSSHQDLDYWNFLLKMPRMFDSAGLDLIFQRVIDISQTIDTMNFQEDMRLQIKARYSETVQLLIFRYLEDFKDGISAFTVSEFYNSLVLRSSQEALKDKDFSVLRAQLQKLSIQIEAESDKEAREVKLAEFQSTYNSYFERLSKINIAEQSVAHFRQRVIASLASLPADATIISLVDCFGNGLFLRYQAGTIMARFFDKEPIISIEDSMRIILAHLQNGAVTQEELFNLENRFRNELDELRKLMQPAFDGSRSSQNKKLIYVIHSDLTTQIPIHCLGPAHTAGDDITVIYLLNLLWPEETQSAALGEISVFSNPEFWDPEQNLEAATAEGAKIAAILSNLPVNIFDKAAATRGNFENCAAKSRVLHFAGHAEFSAEQPGLSALRFFLHENRVEKLTSAEFLSLDLTKCDLVFLSGCNTMKFSGANSNEISGLVRGLTLAGARCVIGTQYPVTDDAALIFAESFYQAFAEGSDVLESYRQALGRTAQKYSPLFWGPFALSVAPKIFKSQKRPMSFSTDYEGREIEFTDNHLTEKINILSERRRSIKKAQEGPVSESHSIISQYVKGALLEARREENIGKIAQKIDILAADNSSWMEQKPVDLQVRAYISEIRRTLLLNSGVDTIFAGYRKLEIPYTEDTEGYLISAYFGNILKDRKSGSNVWLCTVAVPIDENDDIVNTALDESDFETLYLQRISDAAFVSLGTRTFRKYPRCRVWGTILFESAGEFTALCMIP